MIRFAMPVLALGALLASATASSAACVMAGGEATMVTEDLAKFMANAALNNSIKAHGWTAQGPVKMSCEASSVGLPHCIAKQRACG
jgi:hypothetical protein